ADLEVNVIAEQAFAPSHRVGAKHLEGVSHVGRSVCIEDRRGDVVGPSVGSISHGRCVFLWFDFLNLTKAGKENAVKRWRRRVAGIVGGLPYGMRCACAGSMNSGTFRR